MKTLEALENDILLQIPYLQEFTPQKQLPEKIKQKTIFSGSGDSLAAAMLVESFSNFKVRAIDPLDIIKNHDIIKNKKIFLISISGKTIANIKAAKLAKDAISISSDDESKLAKICKKNILLDYPSSGIFTSGSISFISSALTSISLVSKFQIKNVLDIFKRAIIESQKTKLGKKIFIIGNLHTFPVTMYSAAKFHEILGKDAHYERIEQFMHMGVFAANRGDTVIIFEEKNPHNTKIVKKLQRLGLRVFQPNLGTKDKISQIIFFSLFSQLTPLFHAKKNHQKECYFVTAKKLRRASSDMIY